MMAFIDSTFTMPGLAGIALAIGMAVDANVLIYERMREELMINKEPLRTAARLGFARAFNAIFDSHVTNVLVCLVLIFLAGAEVRGFGVTTVIGSAATVLGGVWVSRVLMAVYTDWFKARKLPMVTTVFPAVNRWILPHIDWIRLRPAMLTVALVLGVGGVVLTLWRGGSMLDTEFRGGVSVTMTMKRVETTPYAAQAGDTAASIAAKTPGVPTSAIEALNPEVNFSPLAAGTIIRVPTTACSADGRVLLSRHDVEERLKEAGRAAPVDSIAGQFRTPLVLAVGSPTQDFRSSAFQIKIGNPAGGVDETKITSEAVATLAKTFSRELDAQLARTFRGSDAAHSEHTRPIDKRTIGEVVGRPEITDAVGRLRGGAAVLVEDIEPPITLDEARGRLERMRMQPDFSDVAGREVRMVGLDPVDPANPEKGYHALAVLVSDPTVNLPKVPLETWDSRLAKREWELVKQALGQEASLDQVSSFSPSVAQSLLANAVIAICLSLILMLGYIWLRFGSLRYSVGTILSLAFNLCVTLGFLAISPMLAGTALGASIGITEFRIDLNVIAALLAIVGHDINNSIVILDRVRERRGRMPYATRQVVNDAINQTFSRSILTSGTTITSVVIMVIFGGESLRPFAATLLVGLVAGLFSAIGVAAPLAYAGKRHEESAAPPAPASGATALARPA